MPEEAALDRSTFMLAVVGLGILFMMTAGLIFWVLHHKYGFAGPPFSWIYFLTGWPVGFLLVAFLWYKKISSSRSRALEESFSQLVSAIEKFPDKNKYDGPKKY